ncbi:MAG: 5-(carboxyamino)imidazole ribonucleotide synthase [Bacteroidota bacterium]|nr:5-(carboxyamino)imidazole ribonucleotide synthase [Bacteroidota bacterium]
MEKFVTSNLKLGIIAGGQLGKMLIQEASKWDIATYVLDKKSNCPAGSIASVFVKGNHLDFNSVYQFGKKVDILTYELENINIDALLKLKSEGLKIVPDPDILKIIQDKGLQKDFYSENNIPTVAYQSFKSKDEIIDAITTNHLNFPFVQKLRKGGYDGKGVAVIRGEQDLVKLLEGASIVEENVDISKEIAVVAARNEKGEIKCFPIVEMVFDSRTNIVEMLVCPSEISKEQSLKAIHIAEIIIEKLGMAGLLAVEFFVDVNGEILVNEVAPRPHNSGHHTIESVITSQFEQHLRAILNLPLGSTQIKLPAVMLNLLGEKGYEGPVRYEGLTESLAIEGVKIHLYGKKITKPNRKMGHVTVVSTIL